MRREVGDDYVDRSPAWVSRNCLSAAGRLSYLSKQLLIGALVELNLHALNTTVMSDMRDAHPVPLQHGSGDDPSRHDACGARSPGSRPRLCEELGTLRRATNGTCPRGQPSSPRLVARHSAGFFVRYLPPPHHDVVLTQEADERRRGDAVLLGQRSSALTCFVPPYDVLNLLCAEALGQPLSAIPRCWVRTILAVTRDGEALKFHRGERQVPMVRAEVPYVSSEKPPVRRGSSRAAGVARGGAHGDRGRRRALRGLQP